MTRPEESAVYSLIGEAGFRSLVSAFYASVATDEVLRPMYPAGDLAAAENRLSEFLVFRFGGPDRYIRDRGHPRLRMRHVGFPIDQVARDRWIDLMNQALSESSMDKDCAAVMRDFFEHAATFLINRPT